MRLIGRCLTYPYLLSYTDKERLFRLLDLGFQSTVTRILTSLPKQRRTGLFSATMTDADALSELVRVGLRNPARIVVKVQSKRGEGSKQTNKGREVVEERRIPAKSVCCLTIIFNAAEFDGYIAHSLQNFYIECHTSEKLVQLTRIVSHEILKNQSSQFIVYFATCACVDYFYRVAIS